MDAERWQRIKDIINLLDELPVGERGAFLDEACAEDASLREEVLTLMEAEEEATFIERPLVLKGDAAEKGIGRRIGAYELTEEIGRGGMGVVYLAQRADRAFEKRVAVKLLQHGWDAGIFISRFKRERRILANLDHPNIARLLDGGLTDDGMPYIVMEYIEGIPLHRFCDENRLTIRERLVLFRKVCDAVAFAHRNLIVHRDLKPGNVLVDKDGEPKLLDFGIAASLGNDAEGMTVTYTAANMMTPEYASPEQLSGRPVNISTDVYSLGVILYQLLTGSRPYTFKDRSLGGISKVIESTKPAKPSTIILKKGGDDPTTGARTIGEVREGSLKRLHRVLKGDLDNITLKALRKESERRYASVDQFNEDVRRYLEGFPVQARRETNWYVLSKLAARHRAVAAAAVLSVLLTIAFVITVIVQNGIIRSERDRATYERDTARQVTQFLEEIFEASDPFLTGTRKFTVENLLDNAEERFEAQGIEDPMVRAEILLTIGRLYADFNLDTKALPLFEAALSIRAERLPVHHPGLAEVRLDLGLSLIRLSRLEEAARYLDHVKRDLAVIGNGDIALQSRLIEGFARLEAFRNPSGRKAAENF
ncbi:MAG: serine/threonine-protein kinase [Acidobacteriota bacterium]|nr:serine/threonine-protein kinase [Acidobacteriota bacterium]